MEDNDKVLKFIRYNLVSSLTIKSEEKIVVISDNNNLFDAIKVNHKNTFVINSITQNFEHDVSYVIYEVSNYLNIKKDLEYLKNIVDEQTKIVLLANNCFGVKYICGANFDYNTKAFDSLVNNNCGISKSKLSNIVDELNFKYKKFYYPFPDYIYPSIIFCENYVPDVNFSKLIYSLHYEDGSKILIDEHKLLKNAINNEQFENFVNSFILVLSKSDIVKEEFKFNSFNNLRKEKYRLDTKVYSGIVKKKKLNDASSSHIATIKNNIDILKKLGFNLLDCYEDDAIISKYVDQKNFIEELSKFVENKKIDDIFISIDNWYKNLYSLLKNNKNELLDINNTIFEELDIKINNEVKSKLEFVKYCFIDLTFENTFYIKNKFYFFDQEWCYKNTPIEYVLFRALNNLYLYIPKISSQISFENMLSRFNILKYKQYFISLEEKFQNEVLDEFVVKAYGKFYSYYYNIEQKEKDLEEQKLYINKQTEYIAKLTDEIKTKENENEKLKGKLNEIYDSKIWKIISKFKGWKNEV